jgi:hypothetical protein
LYWQSGQHAAGYVPFASTSINFLMRSPIYISGGNVGIGTANPAALLHLGGTGITPTIRLGTDRAGRNFQIVSDTGGPLLDFQLDNGTSLMTIRSTGNVGIGTTNPQYKLQVVSGSGRWTAINADGSIVVNRDGAPPYILFQGSGGGVSYIYNPSEGTRGRAMAFYTQADGQNYSEKVRITGAGNVGIGTTNPRAKLEVAGAIRLTPTTQPSNATTGMMYFDQSSGVFKCFQKDEYGNYSWVDCVRGTIPPGGGVATLTVPVRIYDSTGQRIVLEINEE